MKIIVNPDKKVADRVRAAIKANDGFCPCKLEKNEDTHCPCKEMREEQNCHCGLFMKVIDVNKE